MGLIGFRAYQYGRGVVRRSRGSRTVVLNSCDSDALSGLCMLSISSFGRHTLEAVGPWSFDVRALLRFQNLRLSKLAAQFVVDLGCRIPTSLACPAHKPSTLNTKPLDIPKP